MGKNCFLASPLAEEHSSKYGGIRSGLLISLQAGLKGNVYDKGCALILYGGVSLNNGDNNNVGGKEKGQVKSKVNNEFTILRA